MLKRAVAMSGASDPQLNSGSNPVLPGTLDKFILAALFHVTLLCELTTGYREW